MRSTNWLDPGAVRIIDEALAKRFFPGRNPIGAQIGNDEKWATIVGVVGTVHDSDLAVEPAGTIYIPGYAGSTVVVRAVANPLAVASAVSEQLRALNGDVAIYDVEPMTGLVSRSLVRQRFATTLLGLFALAALVLSFVGVYSVTAYRMTKRIHEIGLRMALGAQRSDILQIHPWFRLIRSDDWHRDRLCRFTGLTPTSGESTLRRQCFRLFHFDVGELVATLSDRCRDLHSGSTRDEDRPDASPPPRVTSTGLLKR